MNDAAKSFHVRVPGPLGDHFSRLALLEPQPQSARVIGTADKARRLQKGAEFWLRRDFLYLLKHGLLLWAFCVVWDPVADVFAAT
ncbi:MAG: hypothetical protein KGL37_09720, partial [Acidobacteriota bacterium]|nr:hypothetical protein [Acidobacteriota bacterium]